MLFNEADWETSQRAVGRVCTGVCPEHLLLAADNKCRLNPKKIPSEPAEHLRQRAERGAVISLRRYTQGLARINSWACPGADRRDAGEDSGVC